MTHLKEGSKAPSFQGIDQNGNKISLKDYVGKKLVLYFYPHDNTPTCTTQACHLRDNYDELTGNGFEVIGVSTDEVKSHKKFHAKFSLPFPLIADENKVIVNKYGVWGEKKFMGRTFDGTHRTTFLIDEKGKIKRVISKPLSKMHTTQILEGFK